jgi:molybdate transport system regulatory protein
MYRMLVIPSTILADPKQRQTDMQNNSIKSWNIRCKLWLEVDGHPLMGEGRVSMLQAIHQHGSIIEASRKTGIAYRKIRGAIRDIEKTLGRSMVRSFRGGKDQGGADLTQEALALIESYSRLAISLQDELDRRLQDLF